MHNAYLINPDYDSMIGSLSHAALSEVTRLASVEIVTERFPSLFMYIAVALKQTTTLKVHACNASSATDKENDMKHIVARHIKYYKSTGFEKGL